MKIISDPIQSGIGHSITKKDIQTILKVIPKDWVGIKNVYHISSQMFENTQWDRPVILNGVTYKIHSRGLDKYEVVKDILIAMAERPFGLYIVRAHSLRPSARRKLEEFVKPYFEAITKKINMV